MALSTPAASSAGSGGFVADALSKGGGGKGSRRASRASRANSRVSDGRDRGVDEEKQYLRTMIAKLEAQNKDLLKRIEDLTAALLKGERFLPSDRKQNKDEDEGFIKVESKKTKERTKSKEKRTENDKKKDVPTAKKEELRLPTLIPEDWPVPIITASEFQDNGQGVAMLTQAEGEHIAREMLQCCGKLAIITPKPIQGAASRESKVKVRLHDGRVDYRAKFLTCVGDKEVKPAFEKPNVVSDCTLKLTNKTKKIVMQVQEGYLGRKQFEDYLKNISVPFETWQKETNLEKDVVFSSRPFLKERGDSRWLEMVVTIREGALTKFLQASGQRGVFVSAFLEKGEAHDLAVVWLEEGVDLKEALSRASRHHVNARGVVAKRTGLGIRVPKESFLEMVGKFLSPTAAAKEIRKQGQSVFEVSNAPPWLDVEDLIRALRTQWNWDVDYVRTIKRWNTKSILLKSTEKPKKDTIIVEFHKMTVQPAKERETGRITTKVLPKREAGETPKQESPSEGIHQARKVYPAQTTPSATQDTSKLEKKMEDMMALFRRELEELKAKSSAQEGRKKKFKRAKKTEVEALVDDSVTEFKAHEQPLSDVTSFSSSEEETEQSKKKKIKGGS